MKVSAETYLGSSCPHGHDGLRYVRGKACVTCVRAKGKIIWANRGEKWRAMRREAYATEGGREYRRERNLISKYGITAKRYEAMLALQNDCCGICKASFEQRPVKRLVVDHDHRTDQIRDLLCTTCNIGLGAFTDDPEKLNAAIKYLKRHRRG